MYENIIIDHLMALGVWKYKRLVVHSNLAAFGIDSDILETLFNAFFKLDVEVLVVPSYTFSDEPYSLRSTPGSNVGIFSEFIRKQTGAIRSACPIHNHVAIGNVESDFWLNNESISMGKGSDFSVFEDKDFGILLLGTSIERGCTYLHHLEALWCVPYREILRLPRRVVDETTNEIRTVYVEYFARKGRSRSDFSRVRHLLLSCADYVEVPLRFGSSRIVSVKTLYEAVGGKLNSDLLFLKEIN